MTDSNPDFQKQTLGLLLAHVSRLVGMRMRAKLHEFGLSHTQGMILGRLWRKDGVAQTTLAQALNITPATTTSTLQRMEKNGWIQRHRMVTDQRTVQVQLTEKANILGREIRTTFEDLDRELTSVLSQREQKSLFSSLIKVQQHLSRSDRDTDHSEPEHACEPCQEGR